MNREALLDVLGSFMDVCDNPDVWEELLHIRHNQDEFSDKEIEKRLFELFLSFIREPKE
jgi:hypothetical protein